MILQAVATPLAAQLQATPRQCGSASNFEQTTRRSNWYPQLACTAPSDMGVKSPGTVWPHRPEGEGVVLLFERNHTKHSKVSLPTLAALVLAVLSGVPSLHAGGLKPWVRQRTKAIGSNLVAAGRAKWGFR
jgi:hypothetical protein